MEHFFLFLNVILFMPSLTSSQSFLPLIVNLELSRLIAKAESPISDDDNRMVHLQKRNLLLKNLPEVHGGGVISEG